MVVAVVPVRYNVMTTYSAGVGGADNSGSDTGRVNRTRIQGVLDLAAAASTDARPVAVDFPPGSYAVDDAVSNYWQFGSNTHIYGAGQGVTKVVYNPATSAWGAWPTVIGTNITRRATFFNEKVDGTHNTTFFDMTFDQQAGPAPIVICNAIMFEWYVTVNCGFERCTLTNCPASAFSCFVRQTEKGNQWSDTLFMNRTTVKNCGQDGVTLFGQFRNYKFTNSTFSQTADDSLAFQVISDSSNTFASPYQYHDMLVDNCDFTDCRYTGRGTDGATGSQLNFNGGRSAANGGTNVTITNCRFSAGYHCAIRLQSQNDYAGLGQPNSRVSNLTVTNCTVDHTGVSADGTPHEQIPNNNGWKYQWPGQGIYLNGCDNATITNCTSNNNRLFGLSIQGCSSVIVDGGHYDNNYRAGAWITGDYDSGGNTQGCNGVTIRNGATFNGNGRLLLSAATDNSHYSYVQAGVLFEGDFTPAYVNTNITLNGVGIGDTVAGSQTYGVYMDDSTKYQTTRIINSTFKNPTNSNNIHPGDGNAGSQWSGNVVLGGNTTGVNT